MKSQTGGIFHTLYYCRSIPKIRLFQTQTLKLQGQDHVPDISKFELETSKVKVMSEVKGHGHIYYTQYPTDALPFRFTSIGPTIPEIWPK